MSDEKFVHYTVLEDGAILIYPGGAENGRQGNDSILWEDMAPAVIAKCIHGRRPPPAQRKDRPSPAQQESQPTKSDGISALERKHEMTVHYALARMYGKGKLSKATVIGQQGRVIKFNNPIGSRHPLRHDLITIIGNVTAAFVKSHQNYTSHVSHGDRLEPTWYKTAVGFLGLLLAEVKNSGLDEDEQHFIRSFYQGILTI